ncbi:hypothetical protein FTS55_15810 [Salmonella enterica subsp. enterica]|nr:hypothetical protein [Salmonella enterica subsp. enterica serovar Menston]
MTFEDTVDELKKFHTDLWFNAQTGIYPSCCSAGWKHAEITTTAGKILAMQCSNPDQWELCPNWKRPDSDPWVDEPVNSTRVTDKFLGDVRFEMLLQVTPFINEKEDFTPPPE